MDERCETKRWRNSNQLKKYGIPDYNVESTPLYYRLKQADFNGDSSYFPVITTTCNAKKNFSLELFSNPSNSANPSQLIINNPAKEAVTIHIYNALGKEVYNSLVFPSNESTSISLETISSSTADGAYSILVQTLSGRKARIKMVAK